MYITLRVGLEDTCFRVCYRSELYVWHSPPRSLTLDLSSLPLPTHTMHMCTHIHSVCQHVKQFLQAIGIQTLEWRETRWQGKSPSVGQRIPGWVPHSMWCSLEKSMSRLSTHHLQWVHCNINTCTVLEHHSYIHVVLYCNLLYGEVCSLFLVK